MTIEHRIALFDVPDLIQKRFPDALFERLRCHQDATETIRLVPEPCLSPDVDGKSQHHSSDVLHERKDVPMPDTEFHVSRTSEVIQHSLSGNSSVSVATPQSSRRNSKRCRSRGASSEAMPAIKTILKSLSYGRDRFYNPRAKAWRNWPETGNRQAINDVASYLNDIVASVRKFLSIEEDANGRIADCVFSTKPVRDSSYYDVRQPGFVLVPEADAWRPSWWDVYAIGMLCFNPDEALSDISTRIAEYARLCFRRQRGRRFVLGFSLMGAAMHLWKFDRSGILASSAFDVHENPLDFLRIILGITLGSDYYLGLDPSFSCKGEIMLNEKKYTVRRTIQLNDRMDSRGTSVLLVEDPESAKQLVMKDQWVDRSWETKEIDMLKVLKEKNVQKVARLVDYQLVHFEIGGKSVPDNTEYDRASIDHHSAIRDHYRLLISPYGSAPEDFRSLKELVSVFKDYVEAIWDLYKAGVLHRDIGPRNLIIVDEDGSAIRRGYIIDFDVAISSSRYDMPEGDRTGTIPFMAIEKLIYGHVHSYRHDLESLFYVLLFICCTEYGPRDQWGRPEPNSTSFPINCWKCVKVSLSELERIGNVKLETMVSDDSFQEEFLSRLSWYFGPIEGLLQSYREVIFKIFRKDRSASEPEDVDYVFRQILHSFDKTLDELPDADKTHNWNPF